MERIIQFSPILAVLLLLCLAPMPYGYYGFVRFVAMVSFAIMAYTYYKKKSETLAVVFYPLVLVFQPYFKVALGRTIWNIVDVVVAIGLVALWLRERNKGNIIATSDVSKSLKIEENVFELEENVFELEESAEIEYLIHFAAPFTGSDKCIVPKGTVFIPHTRMRGDALYMRIREKDEELLKIMLEKVKIEYEELYSRLRGFSFFITEEQLRSLPLKFHSGSAERLLDIMRQLRSPLYPMIE